MITTEIVTETTIVIALGMIVIMAETVTGATTGIEIGTGEIAIAAIGIVIDDSQIVYNIK